MKGTRNVRIDAAPETHQDGAPTEDDVRDALFPAEKERIVKLLVREVVVSKDGLLIRLRLNGLNLLVAELQAGGPSGWDGPPADTAGTSGRPAESANDGQTVNIRVPIEFKVRGRRREIILSPDAETEPEAEQNRPMILALARAYKWQEMLDSGEVSGIGAIAAQHGVDRAYVSRMIMLTSLAPEIVEMILAGDEPDGLSLAKLRRDLPLRWDEQWESFRGAVS